MGFFSPAPLNPSSAPSSNTLNPHVGTWCSPSLVISLLMVQVIYLLQAAYSKMMLNKTWLLFLNVPRMCNTLCRWDAQKVKIFPPSSADYGHKTRSTRPGLSSPTGTTSLNRMLFVFMISWLFVSLGKPFGGQNKPGSGLFILFPLLRNRGYNSRAELI